MFQTTNQVIRCHKYYPNPSYRMYDAIKTYPGITASSKSYEYHHPSLVPIHLTSSRTRHLKEMRMALRFHHVFPAQNGSLLTLPLSERGAS